MIVSLVLGRALGQQLFQEHGDFSLDLDDLLSFGQLGLGPFGATDRPGEIATTRRHAIGSRLLTETGERTDVACTTPLGDVARVQAFPPQEGAFVAGAGAGVVAIKKLELVRRREMTPVWSFGK
jgi:hypothetical protein